MGVTMRIIQRFDPRYEREFMELEREFARLEGERPDYPKGRRMQPISACEPPVPPALGSFRAMRNFLASLSNLPLPEKST